MSYVQKNAIVSTIVMICILYGSYIFSYGHQTSSLALIDTADRDPWLYKPAIEILESVGYKVTYKPLDLLIDQSVTQFALPRYQAVFFILGVEFLSGLHNAHVSAKVLRLIENYAKLPHVTIGLIFPSLSGNPNLNVISKCAPIFNSLGLVTPRERLVFPKSKEGNLKLTAQQKQQRSIDAFFYLANVFLAMPPESRPLMYHTSLHMPHAGIEFDFNQFNMVLQGDDFKLSLLPKSADCSLQAKMTLPYGLTWLNPVRKNHVFIASSALFTFSSITEGFHICPLSQELRSQMLVLMQRMMWELIHITANKKITSEQPKLAFSKSFGSKIGMAKHGASRKIAWMEILVFDEPTAEQVAKNPNIIQERAQQQDQFVQYILKSGLDALWITINPQLYYSPIGRLAAPEKERIFINGLSLFTKKLTLAAKKYGRQLPRLLVGYEIVTNIYPPNLPTQHAVDLYGGMYPDLPAPLNKSFWMTEIIQPLRVFMEKWKNQEISHGYPIDGVVIDGEMYCRKKTGTFSTAMGFDGATFQKFASSMRMPQDQIPLRDRSLLLMNKKMGRAYFNFLENQAADLGNLLRKNFTQLIPGCKIMCYVPNIHVSWFYKGLYKGLSSQEKPLELLTFNTEFFAHEPWFKQHKIPLYHASVLMLSKIKEPADFSLIGDVLSHHYGIWLNRFSRFVERKATDWTAVEQPSIDQAYYPAFMDYLRAQ